MAHLCSFMSPCTGRRSLMSSRDGVHPAPAAVEVQTMEFSGTSPALMAHLHPSSEAVAAAHSTARLTSHRRATNHRRATTITAHKALTSSRRGLSPSSSGPNTTSLPPRGAGQKPAPELPLSSPARSSWATAGTSTRPMQQQCRQLWEEKEASCCRR